LFGPSLSADPSQSAAVLAARLITLASEDGAKATAPEVVVLGRQSADGGDANGHKPGANGHKPGANGHKPGANGASVATLAALEISRAETGLEATRESSEAAATAALEPPAPAEPAKPAPPATKARTVAVGKGDTLMKVLVKGGAERRQAHDAISALSKVFNPRKLKAGQEVTLTFRLSGGEAATPELIGVGVAAGVERELLARRGDNGRFAPEELKRELERRVARAGGSIKNSLYLAATRAKLPVSVLMEMIRIFSWDVDFQRDIQPGDRFDVVYERLFDERGRPVRAGKVLRASLTLSGVDLTYYRFTPADDEIADYFDAKGRSVRKALLRTPIDGAKLTSRYGKRKHPILGYTRIHPGVDFGAAKGTPIYAAGDGKVEAAGWEGNYGRYVRLRHNRELKTAYAHMTRIAKKVRRGKRVRQGQVIGYVGSTGLSTGPHLHYEVLVKGRRKNPMSVKLPTGRRLEGKELKGFKAVVAELETRVAAAEPHPTQVAANTPPGN
jgi:murein DD-endopeptidase MepM/ murein hydrolase activator NlpD